MNNERILILDFGGHFNQLVARRVRECLVYCEVFGSNMSVDEVKKYNPKVLKCLILSKKMSKK